MRAVSLRESRVQELRGASRAGGAAPRHTEMKRVLVIAYFFPPIATSGSLRPLGFCQHLARHGFWPRVLTTEPGSVHPPLAVDEGLLERLPAHVEVERVPHASPLPRLIAIRNRLRGTGAGEPALRNGAPAPTRSSGAREHGLRARAALWADSLLSRAFSVPDPQCLWRRPAVKRLSRLSADERPHVVFATGGPWTSLLAAKQIAERFGVPFVADFRDPWTGNPSRRSAPASLSRIASTLEESVCRAASFVVTNTEELNARFQAAYPELAGKFTTITNGFDREGLESVLGPHHGHERRAAAAGGEPPVELCHFGSIYGHRSPEALLQALEELRDRGMIHPGQIRVRFVGSWETRDERCESLARNLERHGFVRREPQVAHDVSLRRMASAQILLVLQPASPLQIPGKIYEYIAMGRPLLVIGGEGATANLVERHGLGTCCPNLVDEIRDTIWQVAHGRIRIESPGAAVKDRFDYRNLTGELARVLEDACSDRSWSARRRAG